MIACDPDLLRTSVPHPRALHLGSSLSRLHLGSSPSRLPQRLSSAVVTLDGDSGRSSRHPSSRRKGEVAVEEWNRRGGQCAGRKGEVVARDWNRR